MSKFFKQISFFTLLLLAFSGCDKESIKPNTEFTLKINKTKTIQDGVKSVSITYTDLLEDSRCPEESTCVWAGRAVVLLTDDKKTEYKLGIGDLEAVKDEVKNEVEIDGFTFKLIDVKDRSITLKVTK
jgi:hypothetical protein